MAGVDTFVKAGELLSAMHDVPLGEEDVCRGCQARLRGARANWASDAVKKESVGAGRETVLVGLALVISCRPPSPRERPTHHGEKCTRLCQVAGAENKPERQTILMVLIPLIVRVWGDGGFLTRRSIGRCWHGQCHSAFNKRPCHSAPTVDIQNIDIW